jgi:hypothetical membrane protein
VAASFHRREIDMDTLTRTTPARVHEPVPERSPAPDDIVRRGRLAGLLMAIAGIGMVMGFITGEALYPRVYTTTANSISDLGGTLPPNSVWFQPSRGIFIATVLIAGALILAADVLLFRAYRRMGFAIAMAAFGLGALGVGVFPGNVATWHPLFSMLAFVGGSVAAILSFRIITGPFRMLAVALGSIALIATVLGSDTLVDWGPGATLGVGGIERWIVYPVILWMTVLGGYLLGRGTETRGAR